jgi:Methyltransferase domain
VTPTPSPLFDDAWAVADGVPGWLTRDQARMLWDEARRLPPGSSVLEIGSHKGRSTVVLGSAVRGGGSVVAVDPFVDGRLFGGPSTREVFESTLDAAGLTEVVTLTAEYSTRLRPRWTEPIDLLYIDGKHDYWTVSDDLRWSAFLPTGAAVLVHDCYSSIGVTLGVLAHVLPARHLAYERRAGSMALFRVRRPTVRDRVRILAELPWWLRNVGIKVLLRLRLQRVAERLGHQGPYDPY